MTPLTPSKVYWQKMAMRPLKLSYMFKKRSQCAGHCNDLKMSMGVPKFMDTDVFLTPGFQMGGLVHCCNGCSKQPKRL